MARAWFFLVLLNSSSFSATRLSISCLTCPSSSWARRTLFSSCSRVPSASSRAPCSSSFSCSRRRLCLSRFKLGTEDLDLLSEVLVLALDNVQLLQSLVASGLQPEELRGVVAALILGGGNLGRDIGGLRLPLTKNLVEVLAPLLGDEGSSVHPLVLHCQVIEFVVHPGLGLLSVGNLGGERVNQLLALNDLGLQLVAGGLKLLNAAHALSFKARLPQLDFSLGLGEGLQGVGLPHGLVLHLLSEVLKVGGHHLVLGQQRGTILALSIG